MFRKSKTNIPGSESVQQSIYSLGQKMRPTHIFASIF